MRSKGMFLIVLLALILVSFYWYQQIIEKEQFFKDDQKTAQHLMQLECVKNSSCIKRGVVKEIEFVSGGRGGTSYYHYEMSILLNNRAYSKTLYSFDVGFINMSTYYKPDHNRYDRSQQGFAEQFYYDPKDPSQFLPISYAAKIAAIESSSLNPKKAFPLALILLCLVTGVRLLMSNPADR